MIESISNPQIKKIMKLNKNAKYRRQEQAFVAEGWKTVGEALARGVVTTLYVSERFMDTWQDELRETHLQEIEWSPSRTCLLYTSPSPRD